MTERLISILKFLIAVLILPIVVAATISLFNHIVILPKGSVNYFLGGIISYLILHLFIFEPSALFEKGQSIIGALFKFVSPLTNVLSFALPIYAIIILIVYFSISLFTNISSYIGIFIFLISFAVVLHIINSAKSLSSKDDDFLKGHYFLFLELIYVFNIFIIGAILYCFVGESLFLDFFNSFIRITKYTYFLVIKQLFI